MRTTKQRRNKAGFPADSETAADKRQRKQGAQKALDLGDGLVYHSPDEWGFFTIGWRGGISCRDVV